MLALFPSTPPEIPLRAIKYQPNVTLSFVLLNEDSTEGSYVRSWDIREAIAGESLFLILERMMLTYKNTSSLTSTH